jgi:hypothetical protein
MHLVGLRTRIATTVLVASALLLPRAVALATTLHALEHGQAPAASHDLVSLASHGHTHPVATQPHDHGATFGAAKPTISPPAWVGVLVEVVAATTQQSTLRATEPRSRGSGGELVLTLSCVLLL